MTWPRHVSVVGLGKLGAPLAAALARSGRHVIGVDVAEEPVRAINEGRAPVEEPGLQACIEACEDRLSATTDLARAVSRTNVTMIIVPTPSGPDGRFSNAHVVSALIEIGRALNSKSTQHVVTVCSTVMPGSMDGELRAALEGASGRHVGTAGLGFCYNPEFIALGSVIRDLTHPDVVLIGESDPESGEILARIHADLCENEPRVMRMSFVNAELCKIAVNAFVTAKISFANMLAEMCERMPGGDVDAVTAAMGADARIGAKYLKGAIGFGGPCFPRDNAAFAAFGDSLGVEAAIPKATDAINARQLARLVAHVRARTPQDGRVCVLGLAYKPDTGEIEESQGVALCAALAAAGVRVAAHDPMANAAARARLGRAVEVCDAVDEALTDADVVVVATPWPAYRDLPAAMASAARPGAALIDPWRIIDPDAIEGVGVLVPLGRFTERAG